MKRTFKQFLESNQRDDWLSLETIEQIWDDANAKVFDGQLEKSKTKFTLEEDLDYINKRFPANEEARNGHIVAYCDKEGSKHILRFCRPMFRDARDLMEVVVHEMVHQAESERIGYLQMCRDPHGEDFFAWAPQVRTYHNMVLKIEQ